MKKLFFGLIALLLFTPAGTAQPVSGLSGWSLFIDPGHSEKENMGIFGYSEAEKNLRVGLALRDLLLSTTDIDTVYMSRTNDQQQVGLSQRTDIANALNPSFYHSIHSNAGTPSTDNVLMLYGGWRSNGVTVEKTPKGGGRMGAIYESILGRAMRLPTIGNYADRTFYEGFPFNHDKQYPYLSVNRQSDMASVLSEAGHHTSPRQNQLNMNADWKRLEAYAYYWGILAYHGIERPPVRIVTGTVTDLESGLPINGATVQVGNEVYTTDTYESLFNKYSSDPGELRNGFYFLEDVPQGTLRTLASAPGYRAYMGDVTVVDTFFTFKDLSLISQVPPVVASTRPEAGAQFFRNTEPISITFSRIMDRASVEQSFAISPEVGGDFVWANGDRTFIFVPDTLYAESNYTVSIGEYALGFYGDAFDADGDGVPGGAYTFTFRTGAPDVTAPHPVASSPVPNAAGVELWPVYSLTYDEPLDPASLEGRLQFVLLSDGSNVEGTFKHYVVRGQSVVTFLPSAALMPNANYALAVSPGVSDRYGNQDGQQRQFRFQTGSMEYVTTSIDNFEVGAEALWWTPQASGSTAGIVTDSTYRRVQDSVSVGPANTSLAMEVGYGWPEGEGTKLIREYLSSGPPQQVSFDDSYLLQMYVFGDGSGNLVRFAVDDKMETSPTGTEVSPWYTVDWRGWRLVTWDLKNDAPGSWIGNGVVEGRLRFDSIQLTQGPGGAPFGKMYFDDLRLAKKQDVTVAAELATDVPERFALKGNYPNPFTSATAIQFDVQRQSDVTITIYDIAGREVASLLRAAPTAAGTHVIRWDAAALPGGVYLCRMEAGGQSFTGKMVLVR